MQTKNLKWILLILLSFIWGSSFFLINKGLQGLTAIQLGALRIIFSAVFLIIVGIKSVSQIQKNQWKYILLTALFGTFIPAFLFAIAQTQISSSISSILNSLTPLNTFIIGVLFFGISLKKKQLIGIVIGLLGTTLLIVNGAITHPSKNYWYALLVIIASICYAINVNLLRKYLPKVPPLSITTANFLLLLLPAIIVLLNTNFIQIAHTPTVQNALIYIAILGIIGTGFANILFFKLIQISSPVFATSVTYLIPIVAFFWALLEGDTLTPIQFIGALIVLFGVYLTNKAK